MNIVELMRTGHVKRWHIVRVGREQTIAEHMYRVWHICRELGTKMGLDHGRRSVVELMALHHDIAEVKTGDIPTPTKQYVDERTDVLERHENIAYLEFSGFKNNIANSDPFLIILLKMADLIEAIYFLEDEGIGQHASDVKKLLANQLADIHASTSEDDRYKHENLKAVWDVFTKLCPKWTLY